MLQVHDIRETRVYRDARDEGLKEGFVKGFVEGFEVGFEKGREKERQRSIEEKLRVAQKMAALKMSTDEIAEILELDVKVVRKHLAEDDS